MPPSQETQGTPVYVPEMIGSVKSSSGDPRSRRNINISGNLSANQRRNLPSASATSFPTRLATTEITNKPNKPPVACLALPCHAKVMSWPPLRMGAVTGVAVTVETCKVLARDIGREGEQGIYGG